jgi:hypothetical protein
VFASSAILNQAVANCDGNVDVLMPLPPNKILLCGLMITLGSPPNLPKPGRLQNTALLSGSLRKRLRSLDGRSAFGASSLTPHGGTWVLTCAGNDDQFILGPGEGTIVDEVDDAEAMVSMEK